MNNAAGIGPAVQAELLRVAEEASQKAYAPYSKYCVGAAVLGESGTIYSGCNVENASYGATMCAERTAIGTMVAAGEQRLKAVAVFASGDEPPFPCGVCRQVLWEFGSDVQVFVGTKSGTEESTIAKLLPSAFELNR